MKFQVTARVLRAHLFEGFICFLRLRSYYRFLATEHQIKFSHAFTWGQILNPYLPHYMTAFAFFILLYLHGIVPSVTARPTRAGNHSGLPRFVLITRWVRCCLLRRRVNVQCMKYAKFISCPYTFWSKRINNFRFFAMTTLKTVHICSPYHPSRHLPRCCFRRSNLVPTASDPGSLHTHVSVGSTDGTEGQLVLSGIIM
jgi:hypothetical protein